MHVLACKQYNSKIVRGRTVGGGSQNLCCVTLLNGHGQAMEEVQEGILFTSTLPEAVAMQGELASYLSGDCICCQGLSESWNSVGHRLPRI